MKEKSNYLRGGLFLLGATIIAVILALLLGAPGVALLSISLFGFGGALVLILIGDRSK